MNNSLTNKVKQEIDTPGIGVAGVVMCPYFRGACLKSGCELWVELTYGKQKVGRCALAWQAILSTELRQSIDNIRSEKSSDGVKNE
ncbi:hypothetical protein DRQ26_05565 [bacterium]|nr:MAG: hypothetical protein DRQ26_05565 [bacterium]